MTTTKKRTATSGGDDFRTGEGLRALLIRLHQACRGAWRSDPRAGELMEFTADRYVALAR